MFRSIFDRAKLGKKENYFTCKSIKNRLGISVQIYLLEVLYVSTINPMIFGRFIQCLIQRKCDFSLP